MPKRKKSRLMKLRKYRQKSDFVVPFGDFDRDLTQDIDDVAPFNKKRKGSVL